jgi:hypothetical protein
MPITQERMHRLLQAGEEFEMLFANARDLAEEALRQIRSGQRTGEAAVAELILNLAATPTRSASTTLALERQHYKLTRSKNESVRRRRAGLAPAAPQQRLTAEEVARILERDERGSGGDAGALDFGPGSE